MINYRFTIFQKKLIFLEFYRVYISFFMGLTPPVGVSVCNKVKTHIFFYVVQQLPMSIGLCLDERISTNMI